MNIFRLCADFFRLTDSERMIRHDFGISEKVLVFIQKTGKQLNIFIAVIALGNERKPYDDIRPPAEKILKIG